MRDDDPYDDDDGADDGGAFAYADGMSASTASTASSLCEPSMTNEPSIDCDKYDIGSNDSNDNGDGGDE